MELSGADLHVGSGLVSFCNGSATPVVTACVGGASSDAADADPAVLGPLFERGESVFVDGEYVWAARSGALKFRISGDPPKQSGLMEVHSMSNDVLLCNDGCVAVTLGDPEWCEGSRVMLREMRAIARQVQSSPDSLVEAFCRGFPELPPQTVRAGWQTVTTEQTALVAC